jgi:uncharacterized membrane protein YoaK (UPF0700 family)
MTELAEHAAAFFEARDPRSLRKVALLGAAWIVYAAGAAIAALLVRAAALWALAGPVAVLVIVAAIDRRRPIDRGPDHERAS